jgi:hemerythrin-like metal-binding protein
MAYPRLDQHRRQHQLFLEQVAAFRSQLLEGGSGLGHSMSQFLGSWLVNHIMVADKAYASFLRGSSARLKAYDGPSGTST